VVHLQRGESEALGASGGPPISSEQQMRVLRGDFIAHMFWYKKVRWRGVFYGVGLSRISLICPIKDRLAGDHPCRGDYCFSSDPGYHFMNPEFDRQIKTPLTRQCMKRGKVPLFLDR
jgi:hypothetical protein